MGRFLAALTLGCLGFIQLSFGDVKQTQDSAAATASRQDDASAGRATLPPMPDGKSTVVGGVIRSVDAVRDQIDLTVFGGGRMKILFDERTQVFRDGQRTPLRDLRANDHASVETVLDGTSVFALSIHMLSRAPEGECQGQVVSYNPATGELTLNDALSREPVTLTVPGSTSIVREGQPAPANAASDLVKGALIAVKFQSGNRGRGIASQIAILATPGSSFVFDGKITFLDLHSQLLVLTDPRDERSYKIFFDSSRFPESRNLREGSHVKVTANFDGARYVANAIKVD